jgi:hypothetical protein
MRKPLLPLSGVQRSPRPASKLFKPPNPVGIHLAPPSSLETYPGTELIAVVGLVIIWHSAVTLSLRENFQTGETVLPLVS